MSAYKPPSRQGKAAIIVQVSPELRHAFKVACAKADVTMNSVMVEAIEAFVAKANRRRG